MAIKSSRFNLLEKFYKIRSRFNHTKPLSDDLKGDVEDDWQLVGVLDEEFGREGDGDYMELYDSDDDDDESQFPFSRLACHHKIRYRILNKDDLCFLLEEKVSKVSTVLSLSRHEAVLLLNYFNWSVHRITEQWLTHEEDVRKAVGLFKRPVVDTSHTDEITCGFCCKSRVAGIMAAISCGHQMCLPCWTEYIGDAIDEGPGCLTLRCPEGSCEASVGIGLIEIVSNQDDRKKFNDYLLKAYVAGSRKAKWCPAPDCEYAVSSTSEGSNNDVTCKCLHSFCWNCSKEAHTPVGCAKVGEWLSEMFLQSNNWLLAKARPCPNCKKLIEKTSCQLYSRCTLCDYEFRNNALEDVPGDEDTDQNDWMKNFAQSSLERFAEYYDGWSCSEACRKNALTDLTVLKDIRLEFLCAHLNVPATALDFLVDAHIQAVHCWRLLKWLYAYGYYMPQEEIFKKNLFEFMLEQAVKLARMLEKHVDELVQGILSGEISSSEYSSFSSKLIQLTRVTRTYFERLLEALNDDLSEVVSVSRASPKPETDESSCSSPSLIPDSSPRGPARKVIKAEDEESGSNSSPVVDMRSEVLIPSLSPQKGSKSKFD